MHACFPNRHPSGINTLVACHFSLKPSHLNSSSPSPIFSKMEKSWIFPKKNFIKINTHSIHFPQPLPNGNTTGIGIVLRDSRGSTILMVSGSISDVTERAGELWALLIGLKCAFYEGEDNIEIETDNSEAVKEWVDWRWFVDPNHSGVIQQLLQRGSDLNLSLEEVKVVAPSQNRLARYLAEEGAMNRNRLVAFRRSVGMAHELWRLDMGLGPLDPRFRVLEEEEYANMQMEEEDILEVQDLTAILGQEFGEVAVGAPVPGPQQP